MKNEPLHAAFFIPATECDVPFSWTPHYFICAFLTDYAKLKTSDQIVFLHEFSALYQTFGKVS